MKAFLKYMFLFLCGGTIYYLIELLWRGHSHWTMFLLGAMIFLYAGLQNENVPWDYPFWKQLLKVWIITICLEYDVGFIVNKCLGWNVWDYSNVVLHLGNITIPLHLFGQVCLPYAILFIPLCAFAIILDDVIRYIFFGEEKPHYKFF